MGFTIHVDDAAVLAALRRLVGVFDDRSAIAKEVAELGESATRLRFRTETAPDGTRWKPSLRAQVSGGRTLTEAGHLSGSISSQSGADFAEWGVNRIYAAIHQFGGTIRARNAGALRFRLANGGFAMVRAVKMPARPYLGISPDDASDIVAMIQRRLQGALNAP
ncbi:phage virion morphogenesis protein [Accumulibacter sp.]|uniref:phage virion morphogenesis protein n=1 Tax=Accumulibacter sp. TaxID=2053492 RepID=UPI00261E9CF6|nr:phage virion morphogenesis protein [Accumulibacter sp.]